MERLTKYNPRKRHFVSAIGSGSGCWTKIMNRLGTYEEAEEDGRLFISPVKVGDMLWPICFDRVLGAWVVDDQPTRINEVGTKGFFVSASCDKPEEIEEFYPYEMIGDEYFRSHEEAVEAAAAKERPEVQVE